MILPDLPQTAYWEGETLRVRPAFSQYSDADLKGSRLEWWLDGWRDIRGVIENVNGKHTRVTNLGEIHFEVPVSGESRATRLHMRLVTRDGEIASENHQDLYFFPRQQGSGIMPVYAPVVGSSLSSLGYQVVDLPEAKLAVVREMTDEIRDYVMNGGNAIWIAEQREDFKTHLGGIRIVPRKKTAWQGDWASTMSWIFQEPVFRDIPTDGLVDFAFADLTPEVVINGVNAWEFASQVHAGIFAGWLHRVAPLVVERRFGRGKVMICTFRLNKGIGKHPVATAMLLDMLRYMGG
jgi:hypothetical protein